MRQRTITDSDIPDRTAKHFHRHVKMVDGGRYDECWPWDGAVFRKGYGNFHVPGIGNIGAHIVAYLLSYGGSLEPKDCVLHSCDNPPCCRPTHLFKGTKRDNTQDMIRKGRAGFWHNLDNASVRYGEQTSNVKLTAEDVIAIRQARTVGVGQKVLAKQYGVRYQTIQAIDHGRSWAHLQTPLGAQAEKTKENQNDSNADDRT